MVDKLRILCAFTLIFLFFMGCLRAEGDAVGKKDIAPDFKLEDMNHNLFSLSSYKGKQPLILFFWTTWCPFCRKELRLLKDRYAGFLEDGLELLAINVGEFPDVVENFIRNYYLAYRVLLDKDTSVARAYEIIGVPTYIFINKQGYIVFKDNYFPQGEYKELVSK